MLDDFREWLSDNLRYILLGLGVILIVLIIFLVVRLATGSGKKENNNTVTTVNTAADAEEEAVTEGDADTSAQNQSTVEIPVSSELVKDDAALLTLIQQYYTGVAASDIGILSQIVSPWDETVSQNILSADIAEEYQNITVYSKQGLNEGEYVVFAYYEAKVENIETLIPGLAMLYVKTGDGGKLVVDSARDSEADVSAYMTQASNDSDVQALIAQVNRQYEEALASDEALSSYVASIEPEDTSDGGEDSQTSSDSSSAVSNVQAGTSMAATTTINIRQTPSTDAAIMGVLPEGTEITVQSGSDDGWVQIDYVTSNGTISGYVKLEYLTSVGSENALAAEDNDESTVTADGTDDAGDDITVTLDDDASAAA